MADRFEQSGTGNWNVAEDFTKEKIMKHMIYADEYEILATYGTSGILEEFSMDAQSKDMMRLRSIERMRKEIEMIINNTLFAIKDPKDKAIMNEHLKTIKSMRTLIPNCKKMKPAGDKNVISIDEETFNKFLEILVQIKSDINDPINRADMIFINREMFDPKKFKEKVIEDFIEEG
jgi:hypothetical protein